MNKFSMITFVVLALAVAAMATDKGKGHQCVPEPMTMLALIPGIGMLIKRKMNKA